MCCLWAVIYVHTWCAACGHLSDDDVLVLPLDVTDIASHSSATDTVLKTFGQVPFSLIVQHYPFV